MYQFQIYVLQCCMKHKVLRVTFNTIKKLGSERTYLAKLFKEQKLNEKKSE